MSDLSQADLILVEGCINEVGAESIAYPWTETPDLIARTDQSCNRPMLAELQKLKEHFPSATIVVIGYYPLISGKSSIFGFSGTRRVASHATKIYSKRHSAGAPPPKVRKSRTEEHNILVTNSEAFYQHSKADLKDAVQSANSSGKESVFFASLPEVPGPTGVPTVDPRFAYGAPEKHQWMISFRFLFFWAFYKDEKYWFRQPLCREYESNLIERFVCDTNPAFHPNVDGANVYARSIQAVIPATMIGAWKAR